MDKMDQELNKLEQQCELEIKNNIELKRLLVNNQNKLRDFTNEQSRQQMMYEAFLY